MWNPNAAEQEILQRLLIDLSRLELLQPALLCRWPEDNVMYYTSKNKKEISVSNGKSCWEVAGFYLDLNHPPTFSYVRDILACLVLSTQTDMRTGVDTEYGSMLFVKENDWIFVDSDGNFLTLPVRNLDYTTQSGLVEVIRNMYFST